MQFEDNAHAHRAYSGHDSVHRRKCSREARRGCWLGRARGEVAQGYYSLAGGEEGGGRPPTAFEHELGGGEDLVAVHGGVEGFVCATLSRGGEDEEQREPLQCKSTVLGDRAPCGVVHTHTMQCRLSQDCVTRAGPALYDQASPSLVVTNRLSCTVSLQPSCPSPTFAVRARSCHSPSEMPHPKDLARQPT